ncbi:uncharacterized protein METZ01_LOCUS284205, partial [marine metagenome]
MNKRLFSNFRMFFLLSLVGIFGQASASSITDFFLNVVGTYEGEVTWDGGSSPITTTIILEGNSISGTSIYPNGGQSPFTLIKALPETRELIVEWKEVDNNDPSKEVVGQALFRFPPDYVSFEGTWGDDLAYEGGGIWNGISKQKINFKQAVDNTFAKETGDRRHIGKWCYEAARLELNGKNITTSSVLVLNENLIYPTDEDYVVQSISRYAESKTNILINSEEDRLYDFYIEQPAIDKEIEGYYPIQVSVCSVTPEYIFLESDVIELDRVIHQTGVVCERDGLPQCAKYFLKSQDASGDSKISQAELNRFFRHLTAWISMSTGASFEEIVGGASATAFLGPLLTKLTFLNYDYDNDEHLTLSELLHDFVGLSPTSITKEDF